MHACVLIDRYPARAGRGKEGILLTERMKIHVDEIFATRQYGLFTLDDFRKDYTIL